MPDTAVTQAPRLIELIAWLSQGDNRATITYKAAARKFGVTEQQIRDDLDVLVRLSDEHKDFLASVRVAIVADGFTVVSRGPFRRPIQFSAEEGLALLLGLAAVQGGRGVAAKFKKGTETIESAYAIGSAPSADLDGVLAVARTARDQKRKLELLYCGSDGEPSRRITHVHQIVESAGRWYVIAWCEKVQDFRRFRAERILEARLLPQDFRPQVLFKPITDPKELLSADGTVPAQVAFSKKISRWLRERYPNGHEQRDGRYVVTFHVADPAWFVREVLQYGAEAEVLGPEGLREAVKRMVQ
ncbi:MAG TPA: WYL domain-containing protein [Gemmatimonadales bacterium]|nr:WYL domain-containing protein [Gemmatimonadales bacterium]